MGALYLDVIDDETATLRYQDDKGDISTNSEVTYKDFFAIMVSYNGRTLVWKVEGCDTVSTADELISVEIESSVMADSIKLSCGSLNCSYKNLTFYNKFFDAVSLDECMYFCYTGEGDCPDYVIGCFLDEGTPNPMVV